jgi:Zn finger protein HypA/HybF involved in hydrogenase expression
MIMLPCPHCGSTVLRFYNGWIFSTRTHMANKYAHERTPVICCTGCHTTFNLGPFSDSIPDTVARKTVYDAWNKRLVHEQSDAVSSPIDDHVLPCPRCGSLKIKYLNGHPHELRHMNHLNWFRPAILCEPCGTLTLMSTYGIGCQDGNVGDISKTWNRRA